MARRLAALALVLFVAAAPAAADICAANCAEQASHTPNTAADTHGVAEHMSHHHHAAAAVPAAPIPTSGVRDVLHTCSSRDAVVTQSREPLCVSLEKLPAVGEAFAFVPVATTVFRMIAVDGRHGPPDPVHTVSPLRI
jgi:hypothetical protein